MGKEEIWRAITIIIRTSAFLSFSDLWIHCGTLSGGKNVDKLRRGVRESGFLNLLHGLQLILLTK